MNGFTHPDPRADGMTLRQALENAWATLPCANAGHSTTWEWSFNEAVEIGYLTYEHSRPRYCVKPHKGSMSKSWSALLKHMREYRYRFIRSLYRGRMACR
jgi:hypothetical protein